MHFSSVKKKIKVHRSDMEMKHWWGYDILIWLFILLYELVLFSGGGWTRKHRLFHPFLNQYWRFTYKHFSLLIQKTWIYAYTMLVKPMSPSAAPTQNHLDTKCNPNPTSTAKRNKRKKKKKKKLSKGIFFPDTSESTENRSFPSWSRFHLEHLLSDRAL